MFNITQNGELELFFLPIEEKVDQLIVDYQNHYITESYLFTSNQLEQPENHE